MVDTLSSAERSRVMARIRSKDSKPEMVVRRLVHGMGFRFRLHRRDLPGTPDLVLAGRRKAIFVHGCFWHGHEGCRKFRMPRSNRRFWRAKIAANRSRDRRCVRALRRAGWSVATVWECRTARPDDLQNRLRRFLECGCPGTDDGTLDWRPRSRL